MSTGDISAIAADKERIYANRGNRRLLALHRGAWGRVLDVGCGAGDNAAIIRQEFEPSSIDGITHSDAEADIAGAHLDRCWVFDIERELPAEFAEHRFDTMLFSHVLEHLREPADVLARFAERLAPGGSILIAVPNIVVWRQRLKVLRGSFDYEPVGLMDETHLRFITFRTAERVLLARAKDLTVTDKAVEGSVPLWWLRRHILPVAWSASVDRWGERRWPTVAGGRIVIRAIKP